MTTGSGTTQNYLKPTRMCEDSTASRPKVGAANVATILKSSIIIELKHRNMSSTCKTAVVELQSRSTKIRILARACTRADKAFLFRLVHIVLLLRADTQDFFLARLLLVASNKELVQNVVRLQSNTILSRLISLLM